MYDLLKRNFCKQPTPSAFQAFCAGAAAKSFATCTTYPLQVAQSLDVDSACTSLHLSHPWAPLPCASMTKDKTACPPANAWRFYGHFRLSFGGGGGERCLGRQTVSFV